MAANQSGRTKPELRLRVALRAIGLAGFVCNDRSLPGVPDMAFHAERVAVFLNGCYWHSCPACYPAGAAGRQTGDGPNAQLWHEKFVRNEARQAEQLERLYEMGWIPLVFWECELKRDIVTIVLTVKYTLEGSLERPGEV